MSGRAALERTMKRTNPTHRRRGFVIVLVACLIFGLAQAQECTYEVEPNETPATATRISGVGPDSVGLRNRVKVGDVCFSGELTPNDQDAFYWDVGELEAGHRWTLELEGLDGQLTAVEFFDVTFADNGVDVTGYDKVFRLESMRGRPAASEPFLVGPGRYYLGVSSSGGAGQYVAHLRALSTLEYGDGSDRYRQYKEGEKWRGAFGSYGALSGEQVSGFMLDATADQFLWGLELWSALGTNATLTLEGPDGPVNSVKTDGDGFARLGGLGLEEGAYRAVVTGTSGMVRLRLEQQGRRGADVAVEPDDDWDSANLLQTGQTMQASLQRSDYFRLEIDDAAAAQAWDLVLDATAPLDLTVQDEGGRTIQARRRGSALGLHLPAGVYRAVVTGESGTAYTLALAPAATAPDGTAREPNDEPWVANDLSSGQIRGNFSGFDRDVFTFEVSGDAQLYRAQLVGATVQRLELLDAAGKVVATTSGEKRLRLDDLAMLPGDHYIAVYGAAGDYALKLLALGPLPQAVPEAALPSEAEVAIASDDAPLVAAAAADEEQDADEAVAALEVAALPPLPPPPPGILELEPNDDATRAMRVVPNQTHVGRLSGGSDDFYRFYLSDDQQVRIEVVPPEGGQPIRLWFPDITTFTAIPNEPGVTTVIERLFRAGDHTFSLRADDGLDGGYYQLRLTLLGSLLPPIDAEPNDSIAQASWLPSELTLAGRVGERRDDDYYRLPLFDTDVEVEVLLDAQSGISLVVYDEEGDRLGLSSVAEQPGLSRAMLPAGTQTFLRVSGSGHYNLSFAFSTEPAPYQLLARRDQQELTVELLPEERKLAAFWHEGQLLDATVVLENQATEPRAVSLTAVASHPDALLELPSEVTLAAGERRNVPLQVTIPKDLRDDLPLRIEVAATSEDGVAAAAFDAVARCETAPLAPRPFWPLPSSMLGNFDVLWSGLGAKIHGDSEYERRDWALIDGRTGPSAAGYLGDEHLPTFELAGTAPMELVGTILNPRSQVAVNRQLRDFSVEVSLDGSSFTTVLTDSLKAVRSEQAFMFDEPVKARYVRLVFGSNGSGERGGYLGEWKVLAAQGTNLGEMNLAERAVGGHIVNASPWNSGYLTALLEPSKWSDTIDMRDHDEFVFTIGFQHGRAAQLQRIEWLEHEGSQDDEWQHFEQLLVEVSSNGPIGPWETAFDWTLQRDASGVATLTFAEPLWARYVRVRAAKVGEERYHYLPDQVRVIERPQGDDYSSALGEWGDTSREAIYEYLNPPQVAAVQVDDGSNDDRARATVLEPDTVVDGSVLVGEDVDWYRLTVPEGANQFELALTGDPEINYLYELSDSAGGPVAYDVYDTGTRVVLTAYAEPGEYYLHLEEPKRTVVFSWDTSGSVSPYHAITYNSLINFATSVNAEQEAVQLLAFDDPVPMWLLPLWSGDATRVQRAIQEFDRSADSSDSETSLLAATRALASREGTKAIMLITDAESTGTRRTEELWQAFEEVRPRVFTFEISSSGTDYAQDLMQDWADVNSGIYTLAGGIGDFDAGFARASCVLRRAKHYSLALSVRAAPPPQPGRLSVAAPPGDPSAAIEVIFDASGSMGVELPSGEQRITAAKRVLESLVREVLPEEAPFALRAFGHVAPMSCETRLELPLGPLVREEALAAVRGIEPKLLSGTAIGASLLEAVGDLKAATGPRTIILITDGEESCGGDPAAAVKELRGAGQLNLAIVSLDLEPEAQALFEALATEIDATYIDVTSFEALALYYETVLNLSTGEGNAERVHVSLAGPELFEALGVLQGGAGA